MEVVKKIKNIIPLTLLFGVVFLVFKHFMLNNAFHVDTMLYVDAVRAFLKTGMIPDDFFFLHRICNVWIYLPFYHLFGISGVSALTLGVYLLFGVFYIQVVEKIFDRRCALFSFLVISFVPSVMISVTHLKEDFNALLFLFASVSVALCQTHRFFRKEQVACFLSGVLFALGLLCKDTGVFFILLPVTAICVGNEKKYSFSVLCSKLLSFGIGVTLLITIVCPAYIKQVLRLFTSEDVFRLSVFSLDGSLWQRNCSMLLKSLSYAWLLIPAFLYGLYLCLKHKRNMQFVFVVIFLVYLFFLGGSNGFRMRLGLWLSVCFVPLAVSGLLAIPLCAKKFRIFCSLLLCALTILNFVSVYHFLNLRRQINFVEQFYSQAAAAIPDDSVVIGMDTLKVIKFFAGDRLVYKTHPLFPDEKQIKIFKNELSEYGRAGKRIFMLPDFFSYGGRNVELLRETLFNAYSFEEAYLGFYAMYHHMDYFVTLSRYLQMLKNQKEIVVLNFHVKGEIPLIDGDKILIKEIVYTDRKKQEGRTLFYLYKNIVLPLRTAKVYELVAKRGKL